MGLRGLVAALTLEGAVDTECFNAYTEWVLGPRLRRGDMVFDNVGAHRGEPDRRGGRGAQGIGLMAVAVLAVDTPPRARPTF
jgi:hypothetical protein